jgi:uncharacterized membrane protein YcaP (DUF421 family)
MDIVVRAATIYVVVLLGLRILGKREFGQMAPFDLVVLMLIPECLQQALLGEDYSLTTAIVVLTTLLVLVFFTSLVSYRLPRIGRILSGTPTTLVHNGELQLASLDHERVGAEEIVDAVQQAGFESLLEVRWAVLHPDGRIAIIPVRGPVHPRTGHEHMTPA